MTAMADTIQPKSKHHTKIKPDKTIACPHNLNSDQPICLQYRPWRIHHPIVNHNPKPSATLCLQPSPSADLHAAGQLNTASKMGKIPETGIVIDCCIGIDDSALTNHSIDTPPSSAPSSPYLRL